MSKKNPFPVRPISQQDFHDAPIIALIETPIHEMNEDQLRMFIQSVRSKRNSPQTFRASLQQDSDVMEKKRPKRKKARLDDLMSDLGL